MPKEEILSQACSRALIGNKIHVVYSRITLLPAMVTGSYQ